MSIVSNVHSFTPFISGTSKPLTGQRLLKIGFKKTKDNPNPLKSVCASVPFLQPEEVLGNVNALLPHIGKMLEGVQDQIARSLYESSNGLRTEIRTEEISVSQCIAFLAAESSGSRLSAESIGQWFDECLNESLIVLIAGKLGFAAGDDEIELTEGQMETCTKHAKVYKELLQQLAGKNLRKSNWTEKQWKGLETALALAEDGDAMASRLIGKMDEIGKVPEIEELLELA